MKVDSLFVQERMDGGFVGDGAGGRGHWAQHSESARVVARYSIPHSMANNLVATLQ
jgi:hypothetical protein